MTAIFRRNHSLHLAALAALSCVSIPGVARATSVQVLAPPSNLTATSGKQSVNLSWTAGAGASTYDVYASTTRGGEGAHPVEVGIAGTSAVIPNLVGGRRYFFEVRSARGSHLSQPSNEVSAFAGGSLGIAYVIDYNDRIVPFTIEKDGTLTATGKVVPNLHTPTWLAMTPSMQYAYAINGNYVDGQFALSQFRVGLDGSLLPQSTPYLYLGSAAPQQLALDKTGHHAYLVAYVNGADQIFQYDIGTDGSLTASSNPPVPTVASLGYPAVGRLGLYTPNFNGNTILEYEIGAGGALSPLAGGSASAGLNPISVVIDPSGTHLYVVNFTDGSQATVSQYNINRDGSLSPMLMPSVAVGDEPEQMVISPSGTFAYVANLCTTTYYCPNGYGSISGFNFDPSGSLLPVGTVSNIPYLRFMAIDPTSSHLYTSDGYGNVDHYAINADGTLSATGQPVYVGGPEHILIPGGSAP